MNSKLKQSMSLAKPDIFGLTTIQKIGITLGIIGLLILVLALSNSQELSPILFSILSLSLIGFGTIIYANNTYCQG